jgi:tyrosine-protein kinase Etk/Wzc
MNDIQPQQPQQIPHLQMEEVHLQDYLNVIYRRRKTFLLAFLAVFLGVAFYTFTMKPVYQASATLHVKDEKAKSELLDALALGGANPVDAELEILKSRTNAEKVVEQLHLDWRILDRPEDVTFRMLEFVSSAEGLLYTVELTGNGGYRVRDADGALLTAGAASCSAAGGSPCCSPT